ncbi:MAG: UDP-glucose 4-epimerase [Flammeovirgaceae bacterium]|jgi:UDP-glucose 4-epimerase
MSKSLVTGGAGFIGAHVTNDLLKLGHEVIVLDDLSGGFKENVNEKATFIEGSILDIELLDKLFTEHKFDYVYHLAAYAAEGLSHFIKRFNYMNNLIGSVNLINESVKHKIKCFVFTSSIAVYGAGQVPLREDMIPEPEDPYGIAKLAVEQELKVTHEMFGLDYVVMRPHNVYGEYQNLGDMYRNVVGIFMNQIMQGKSMTIFGDGEQSRAFSYISDVSPYIANAVNVKEAYNQVFNIGAEKPFTVNELATTVKKAFNSDSEIRHTEARNEVMHAYSDHSKVMKAFNIDLDSMVTLEEGIGKMSEWAKKTGIKGSQKFKNIEITEKLPPIWAE